MDAMDDLDVAADVATKRNRDITRSTRSASSG
jgi:hypothetical protein